MAILGPLQKSLRFFGLPRWRLLLAVLGCALVGMAGVYVQGQWNQRIAADDARLASVEASNAALAGVVELRLGSLAENATDYGYWDDADAFVRGRNPGFSSTIFVEPAGVVGGGLGLIAYFGPDGALRGSIHVPDTRTRQVTALPPEVQTWALRWADARARAGVVLAASGFLRVGARLMAVAYGPVLPSSGLGAPSGVVMLGAYVDEWRLPVMGAARTLHWQLLDGAPGSAAVMPAGAAFTGILQAGGTVWSMNADRRALDVGLRIVSMDGAGVGVLAVRPPIATDGAWGRGVSAVTAASVVAAGVLILSLAFLVTWCVVAPIDGRLRAAVQRSQALSTIGGAQARPADFATWLAGVDAAVARAVEVETARTRDAAIESVLSWARENVWIAYQLRQEVRAAGDPAPADAILAVRDALATLAELDAASGRGDDEGASDLVRALPAGIPAIWRLFAAPGRSVRVDVQASTTVPAQVGLRGMRAIVLSTTACLAHNTRNDLALAAATTVGPEGRSLTTLQWSWQAPGGAAQEPCETVRIDAITRQWQRYQRKVVPQLFALADMCGGYVEIEGHPLTSGRLRVVLPVGPAATGVRHD